MLARRNSLGRDEVAIVSLLIGAAVFGVGWLFGLWLVDQPQLDRAREVRRHAALSRRAHRGLRLAGHPDRLEDL